MSVAILHIFSANFEFKLANPNFLWIIATYNLLKSVCTAHSPDLNRSVIAQASS